MRYAVRAKRWGWCVWALWVLGAISPRAIARPADVTIDEVRFGLTGVPVGERWMPVRVRVSPGDEPMQGVVVVEAPQDATQSARFVAPLALVPGSTSTISLPVIMRREADEVTVRVEARGATSSASVRRTFARFGGPDEDRLPRALAPETVVVITAGEGAPPRDSAITSALGAGPFQPVSARVELSQLPDAWAAYQQIDLLVVRGADAARLEPRVLAAIRQWVLWGGRLLIIADAPGTEWADWIPGGARGLAALGDVSREGPLWRQPPDLPPADVYPQAPRREVTLTSAATRTGWALALKRADGGAGLLATGPVGLGVVGVLGADPARVVVPGANASFDSLWSAVITTMEFRSPPTSTASWRMASGEDPVASAALAGAMNAVVRIEPIGVGTAALLGAIVLALAIMLGPGDRFVLGRLGLRHRSWLSSLGWIALASVAMLLIPSMIRRTPTTLSRIRVIDQVSAGAAEPAPPVAFVSDLRVAFAASSAGTRHLGLPAGGYVRGVSATGARDNALGGPSALPLGVVAPTPDTRSEPWGGFDPAYAGEGGSVGPVGDVDLRRWSLRALMSMARIAPPITAIASQTGAGRVLRVLGFDRSARLLTAVVHGQAGGDYEILRGTLTDGTLDLSVGGWIPGVPHAWQGTSPSNLGVNPSELAAYCASLPGTGQRAAAVRRRLDSGGWAVLEALVADGDHPELLTGAGSTESYTWVRVMVPAEDWSERGEMGNPR